MVTKILQSHWKLLLLFGFFGAAASFGLSLAKEPLYSAEARILIRYLQTQGVDAYVASRAASKIGQTLGEVVNTELFLQKVLKTPFVQGIEFPPLTDPVARRSFWQNSIDVSVGIDSNILRVSAYAKKPQDAKDIVQAVTYVLLTQGDEFHGAGNLVSLTQVDAPLLIPSPIRSYLLVNSIFGLLLGVLIWFMVSLTILMVSSRRVRIPQKGVVPVAPEPPLVPVQQPEQRELSQEVKNAQEAMRKLAEVASARVNSEYALNGQKPFPVSPPPEGFIHTIFDDLVKLGLDVKKLTVEA